MIGLNFKLPGSASLRTKLTMDNILGISCPRNSIPAKSSPSRNCSGYDVRDGGLLDSGTYHVPSESPFFSYLRLISARFLPGHRGKPNDKSFSRCSRSMLMMASCGIMP